MATEEVQRKLLGSACAGRLEQIKDLANEIDSLKILFPELLERIVVPADSWESRKTVKDHLRSSVRWLEESRKYLEELQEFCEKGHGW